jgi:hypothetical protein
VCQPTNGLEHVSLQLKDANSTPELPARHTQCRVMMFMLLVAYVCLTCRYCTTRSTLLKSLSVLLAMAVPCFR